MAALVLDGLVFADKLLRTVTAGDHNSTYKMATAIALLQAAQETAAAAPEGLEVRRVAEIVVDLYLSQFAARRDAAGLRQMNRGDQSSRLIEAVARLASAGPRAAASPHYPQVLREVEHIVVSYPLRLLQSPSDQFIYEVPEPTRRSRAAFGPGFTGRLVLREGVLSSLRRSAPLLRPLIEAAWVEKVARYNGLALDETSLRRRLFGYDRVAWPAGLREALEALQDGCFYCAGPLPHRTATTAGPPSRWTTHVDHVIPWALTMNDAIENLVLADGRCNLRKSDQLCSPAVVDRWLDRLRHRRQELAAAAVALGWPSEMERTLRVAVTHYEAYGPADVVPAWDGTETVATSLRAAAEAIRRVLDEVS